MWLLLIKFVVYFSTKWLYRTYHLWFWLNWHTFYRLIIYLNCKYVTLEINFRVVYLMWKLILDKLSPTLYKYYVFPGRNEGSKEATLAVKNECIKKRSSCNFGQITSSVTVSCISGREKCSFNVAFPSSEDPWALLILQREFGQRENDYLQLRELISPLGRHTRETFQAEPVLPI